MEEITLRKAEAQDSDDILAIYRACAAWGKETGNTHWTDEYPGRDNVDTDIADGAAYVAVENGRIIGAVALMDTDDIEEIGLAFKSKNAGVLARLCVLPTLQGKRYGSVILEKSHDILHKSGYEACHLLCAKENQVTNALYTRHGYTPVATVHMYGSDYIAYEKQL